MQGILPNPARLEAIFAVDLSIKVGARGFEPPTSASRTRRATRLRYAPIANIIGGFDLFYQGLFEGLGTGESRREAKPLLHKLPLPLINGEGDKGDGVTKKED